MKVGDRIRIVDANLAKSIGAEVSNRDGGIITTVETSGCYSGVLMDNGVGWILPIESFKVKGEKMNKGVKRTSKRGIEWMDYYQPKGLTSANQIIPGTDSEHWTTKARRIVVKAQIWIKGVLGVSK